MAPAETTTPKKALVFVPAPGIGHLVSVMELAKRLLERDDSFSITMLLMSPPFAHDVTTYVEKLSASHPEFQFLGLPSVPPPPLEDVIACPEHFVSIFIADHRNHVKDMIVNHVLSNKSVKLVGLILDLFCTPFVDVAKDLGVPPYIFFASGAAFLGSMLYLPDRFDNGGVTYKPTDPDSMIPSYINPVPSTVLPSLLFHDELESHAVSYLNGEASVPQVYTVGPVVDLKGNSPVADGSQHKVAKAVTDVIEGGGEVKSKVKAMSETGRKALLKGGSSYVAFETLVGVLSGNKA
ncbi:hypothetical protein OIU77_018196 [Salix suchowensis]|uniref:Uncharacterized protein n=1 Tax=Salix suchowensis TaxID=1278906 RepID=A0ABQ8ZRK4_9ROSI|nr:hypothetical protein OIU77_018196 [Salix suchowensis]